MSAPQSNRIVAVDCMTLIWGIRKGPKPADKIERASLLFEQLEVDKATVIVPSVVLAEFLVAVPAEQRAQTAAAMGERFRVEPFDLHDAVLAAELWSEGKSHRQMGKPNARIALRADTLIIATARNHGAQEFFTDDDDCFRLANTVMTARRLPTVPPYLIQPS